MKKERIKQRIIIPILLALFILLLSVIFGFYQYQANHIYQEVKSGIAKLPRLFQESLDKDAEGIHGLIDFVKKDKNLQNAWLAKNKDELLRYASPVFEHIRSEFRITHFYFHRLDKSNFLRVHNPSRYGDFIDRFTMKEASAKGKDSKGIELGPFGTFTLRFVSPWRINGELAGYIELGEEIEHITPQLSKTMDCGVIFAVDKRYLDHSKWEEGLKMMGRTGNWDQFSDLVVIDSTFDINIPELQEYINSPTKKAGVLFDLALKGRGYYCGFTPLSDAAGRKLGEIFIIYDLTDNLAAIKKMTMVMATVCVLIGVGLFVFFYIYAGSLESKLLRMLDDLNKEMQGHKQAEAKLERRSHDLGERVKELKCLYGISTLVNNPEVSLEEILQGTVDLIPSAWQYPEITCARIILDGQEYKTQNHRVTSWKQSSSITVQGKRSGLVEVCYLEKSLEIDEGPFLKEERNLINAIAEKLESITERIRGKEKNKILEMQMRQAEKMEALGQLASGVVHDLSNKLVPIIGFANIILRKINPEEKIILGYLDIIKKEGEEAKSLLSQLLTFARKTPSNPTVMCAHESIKDATKILRRTISKNIVVKKMLKANPSLIYADKSQIHNALLNLGLNARDAMPEGGTLTYATKTIHLHEKSFDACSANLKAGAYLVIKVIDTGEGIDDSIIDNIFEPFFTTKEDGRGTGLGLASVQGTISKHNGDIKVHSAAGKGTTVCLYLPLSTFESEQTKSKRELISGSGNILLVDDEESIGEYMDAFLTELGYSVTFCSSGIQAEKVFDKNHDSIDLVILDMMMPGLDGKETFLRMKKIDPDMRAIIISGYGDQIINAQEAELLGIIERIQKPFDEKYLSKRIAEITMS